MDNTVDLRRLLGLIRQHGRGILITTLACAVVGFILAAFVIPPKYEATSEILVNQRHVNANDSYNTQQSDVQMINTYKDIITNPVILNDASNKLEHPQQLVRPARKAKYRRNADGTRVLVRAAKPAVYRNNGKSYNVSASQLKGMLSVQSKQNSQVFSLTARTGDPEESAEVANSVANVFKRRIKKMMTINNVTIVSRAQVPKAKAFPKNSVFTLAGAVLGLLVSILLVVIRDMLNTTVRDDSFLTDELGLADLGQISHYHMSPRNDNQGQHEANSSHRRV